IYTVDSSFSVADAMVVSNGKVVAIGKLSDLVNKYDAEEKLDLDAKFVYPGFIDAHAHFIQYATALQSVNLVGTNSWNEALERVKSFAQHNPGGWLMGRGWDQNDWDVQDFPTNEKLNELFPGRPVLLTRVD